MANAKPRRPKGVPEGEPNNRTEHPTRPEPPKGKGDYKPRATKAEKNYRTHALLNLANQGFGPNELQRFAVEKFGLSPRRAWDVVNETFNLVIASYSALDYRRLAGILISRYDHIYRRAAAKNDLNAMLSATDAVSRYFMATVKEYEAASPPPSQATGTSDDPEEEF